MNNYKKTLKFCYLKVVSVTYGLRRHELRYNQEYFSNVEIPRSEVYFLYIRETTLLELASR